MATLVPCSANSDLAVDVGENRERKQQGIIRFRETADDDAVETYSPVSADLYAE
jgi:hypothetical protein